MENSNELARDDPAFEMLNEYISGEVMRNVNSAVKTQVTEVWRALKQKVNPLKRKVEGLEENIKTLNGQIRKHEESIAEFKQSIASLSYKIEKLEDDCNTEEQEQEHDISIDCESEDDKKEGEKSQCPFVDDSKYSDVESALFASNDNSKKARKDSQSASFASNDNSKKAPKDSRRQTAKQTKKSQAAKGNPAEASGSGGIKSKKGRPFGSKNKTTPKSILEDENDRLKAKIEKLMFKETK